MDRYTFNKQLHQPIRHMLQCARKEDAERARDPQSTALEVLGTVTDAAIMEFTDSMYDGIESVIARHAIDTQHSGATE